MIWNIWARLDLLFCPKIGKILDFGLGIMILNPHMKDLRMLTLTSVRKRLLFILSYEYQNVDNDDPLRRLAFIPAVDKLVPKKVGIDLDLSVHLFDIRGRILDSVDYTKMRDNSGAITHRSDSLVGAKTQKQVKSAQEIIRLDLADLPEQVAHLALCLHAFHKHPISLTKYGAVHLEDTLAPIDTHTLAHLPSCSDVWLWHLVRTPEGFGLKTPLIAQDGGILSRVSHAIQKGQVKARNTSKYFK